MIKYDSFRGPKLIFLCFWTIENFENFPSNFVKFYPNSVFGPMWIGNVFVTKVFAKVFLSTKILIKLDSSQFNDCKANGVYKTAITKKSSSLILDTIKVSFSKLWAKIFKGFHLNTIHFFLWHIQITGLENMHAHKKILAYN